MRTFVVMPTNRVPMKFEIPLGSDPGAKSLFLGMQPRRQYLGAALLDFCRNFILARFLIVLELHGEIMDLFYCGSFTVASGRVSWNEY